MTYIKTVSEDEATGYVAKVYEASKAAGGIYETSKAISIWPELMRAEEQRYAAVMLKETHLSRSEKEAIALAVSMQNDCGYCAAHHKAMFCDAGGLPEQAVVIESLSTLKPLPERLQQIVAFGLLKHSDEAACAEMRKAGFKDREITRKHLKEAHGIDLDLE